MKNHKNKKTNSDEFEDSFDDFSDDADLEEENNRIKDQDESQDEEKDNKIKTDDRTITLPRSKAVLIKSLIKNIKENSDRLLELVSVFLPEEEEENISIGQAGEDEFASIGESRIIEGVFNGEQMIGPDGKQYSIPANYASKSKLVEGDIMKLTITANGTFVYKQIGPIERSRIVGKLEKGSEGNFLITADGKRWNVLTASVTYFRGQIGDEVIILVPKSGESKWAAVENIIKNK
jgi:hypothetical protein